jgi:hypothetical protein
MPELPELTVIREGFHRRSLSQVVNSAEIIPPGGPIVVRDLSGQDFATVLTGRLQLCEPKGKKAGPVHAALHLSGGQALRSRRCVEKWAKTFT